MRSVLFEYYENRNVRQRFFEEFCFGRKTRADALLVTEQEMIGFEFKSDKVKARVLERMTEKYNALDEKRVKFL